MVNNGESWDDNGIYHLVMTNSSPWNITMLLIGKQNDLYIYISLYFYGPFSMVMLNNQRVSHYPTS